MRVQLSLEPVVDDLALAHKLNVLPQRSTSVLPNQASNISQAVTVLPDGTANLAIPGIEGVRSDTEGSHQHNQEEKDYSCKQPRQNSHHRNDEANSNESEASKWTAEERDAAIILLSMKHGRYECN